MALSVLTRKVLTLFDLKKDSGRWPQSSIYNFQQKLHFYNWININDGTTISVQ